MSSFIRRIQRTVIASLAVHPKLDSDGKPTGEFYANPPRKRGYMNRGSKLGVSNVNDKARVARLKRENRGAH